MDIEISRRREFVRPPRCPGRILLAEGDPQLRLRTASDLRGEGYEVMELEEGDELTFYLRHAAGPVPLLAPPDLVVSDARLPPGAAAQFQLIPLRGHPVRQAVRQALGR